MYYIRCEDGVETESTVSVVMTEWRQNLSVVTTVETQSACRTDVSPPAQPQQQ